MGANLFDDIHFANKNIIQKNSYTCLFLGVDWERKGGKTALKAIEYVRQLYGIDVRLKFVDVLRIKRFYLLGLN